MTKIDFIIVLIASFGLLVGAIKIMSDRISERFNDHKNLYSNLSLLLAFIPSISIAIYTECLHYGDFKTLRFLLNAFCIFSIYLGLSIIIGILKRKLDERTKLKRLHRVNQDIDKLLGEARSLKEINSSSKIVRFERRK